MKAIWQEARALFSQKAYRICMIFTAIMTYGTLILHPTVGIDDTAWKVYYIDGVSAVMALISQKQFKDAEKSLSCFWFYSRVFLGKIF